MLNQIILVGRITEIKKGEKSAIVTVAVPQNFKNDKGEYETNFINIKTFSDIVKSIHYIIIVFLQNHKELSKLLK